MWSINQFIGVAMKFAVAIAQPTEYPPRANGMGSGAIAPVARRFVYLLLKILMAVSAGD
tara:strand:+ start:520 stop:696 length:177 start_codon:yes stop_codon:yes gene_type:complete